MISPQQYEALAELRGAFVDDKHEHAIESTIPSATYYFG
jgi:hypothetical protein